MSKELAFILPILKLGLFCIIGPICRGFSTIVKRRPCSAAEILNPKLEILNKSKLPKFKCSKPLVA